jgi:hypothetical protein
MWNINTENIVNLKRDIRIYTTPNEFYQLNKNQSTVLERFVNSITDFHFERLKIDKTKHVVEFGVSNTKCQGFKKQNGVKSVFSGIIFLEENNFHKEPMIITSLTDELYKYKEFANINITYHFPRLFGHIEFEPTEYYHYIPNVNILIIHIWDKHQPNSISFPIELSISNNISTQYSIECKETISKIILFEESDNFNYDYFDEFIYLDISKYKSLVNLIETNDRAKYDSFEFRLLQKQQTQACNKNELIREDNRINVEYPKFIQRFIKKKVYQSEICNWIIKESENYAKEFGGWTTTRHIEYQTTDLPVNKIDSIFSFVSDSFQTVIDMIKKSYYLDDNFIFNISDVFIVKYDANSQSELEKHKDNSEISINILLSDPSDFEGGGTHFEDDIVYHLDKGDMLIHCGQTKHSGVSITYGKRYILVAFIKIYNG